MNTYVNNSVQSAIDEEGQPFIFARTALPLDYLKEDERKALFELHSYFQRVHPNDRETTHSETTLRLIEACAC